MFSVNTPQEAEELLDRVCFVQPHRWEWVGDFPSRWIATELVRDQTIENLNKFGDRLREEYTKMQEES